jgi:hypothetical protein
VLTCSGNADLALALSGLGPQDAVVTRLAGWIPAGALGTNIAITFQPSLADHPAVIRAETVEACDAPRNDAPVPPPPIAREPGPRRPISTGEGTIFVPASDGCGGGTVGTASSEEEASASDSSADGCSWDTSDGWDDSDSAEGCATDESSTSEVDSCSAPSPDGKSDDGWDDEDSDDGWDTEDEMSPQRVKTKPTSMKKPHARKSKGSSPVSRCALLIVAVLFPLRRRRNTAWSKAGALR